MTNSDLGHEEAEAVIQERDLDAAEDLGEAAPVEESEEDELEEETDEETEERESERIEEREDEVLSAPVRVTRRPKPKATTKRVVPKARATKRRSG